MHRVPLALSEHVNRGFVLPLLGLLAQSAGWEWDLQFAPMARVLACAEHGECLAFGLGRTPAREARLAFTDPLFNSRVWPVWRRARKLQIRKVADLRGLSVCLHRGASYGIEIDAGKGRDFRVELTDGDPRRRLGMLLTDRCDVALMTHRSSDAVLLEHRLRETGSSAGQVEIGPVPLVSEGIHIAGALGSPWMRYLPLVNETLRRQQPAIRALVDSEL
ncbi:MAG TPA: hypothetical protein VK195_17425 [Burkholderiaceae bacterium]|nr:hypothetical protein [Burkholderiaceae bacterium]